MKEIYRHGGRSCDKWILVSPEGDPEVQFEKLGRIIRQGSVELRENGVVINKIEKPRKSVFARSRS